MRVRILGAVEVRDATGWRPAGPAKRSTVLASLALTPETSVSVADLIEHLWGSQPPNSALSTLYGHIARLRSLLGGSKTITRTPAGGYRLELPAGDIDLHHARELAERARETDDNNTAAELWRQCCALWHDTPLSSIDGAWAEAVRDTLVTELLGFNAERFAVELTLGRHQAIIGDLHDLLARFPLNEALTGQLMTALYRADRATEALARFSSLRERMVEELGSEPAKSLHELQRRILNQDTSLYELSTAEPQTSQLPPAPFSFIGREQQVGEVHSLALRHRLIVVDGMAGVGKTALLLHTAHRLASRFPDGQLFCDLRGFSGQVAPLAAAEILNRLLRGLGVDGRDIPVDAEERAALWRRRVAGQRLLIVLDNAATAEQVLPVLPGDDGALVLVSSRRRLPELDEASPITVDTLDEGSAVRLFQRIAAIPETEDDAEPVRAIVSHCGRLPLAIRLAASRLKNRPSWTPADLAKRLNREDTALPELEFGQHGVSATFESSYQDVPADQRRLFRLLGLFPGTSFGSAAAAALMDTSELDAEDVLERLVDAHLLLTLSPGRYEFHDLLRRFAVRVLERDESETSRSVAQRRLLARYCDMTLAAGFVIGPSFLAAVEERPDDARGIVDVDTAAQWCRTEMTNILAMIAAVADTDTRAAITMARGVSPYLSYQARFPELIALAQHNVTVARRLGDEELEAEWLGIEALGRSNHPDATVEQLYLRALELRRRTGNRRRETAVLINLGGHYFASNRLDEAAATFTQAIEVAAAVGAERSEGLARSNLASLLLESDRTDRLPWITENLTRAQRIFEEHHDEHELATVWLHQGTACRRRGEVDAALGLHLRAIACYRSRGEPEDETWANVELARDYRAARQLTAAEEHCAAASRLLTVTDGDARLRDWVTVERGTIAVERGDYRDAIAILSALVADETNRFDRLPIREAHRQLVRAHRLSCDDNLAQHHQAEAERLDKDLNW